MTTLKDAINDMWETYTSAMIAGDVERWISLWSDDAILMPPDAPAKIGKEKIKSSLPDFFARFECKMTINTEEVRETSDWGFARGNISVELTPKGEGEKIKRTGKYLTILEKQNDGSWKMARDSYSYNAPRQ